MKTNQNGATMNQETTGERVKQPYARPQLQTYGSIGQLTKGSAGSLKDANGKPRQSTGSDRSLKQDVARVGEHLLGFGLYLFDYKPAYRDAWGHGRQFGVMSDEVEAVMPQAVSVHPDGYKMVDYGMLGISRSVH